MKELLVKKVGYATLSYIYALGFGTVGLIASTMFAFAGSFGFGEAQQSFLAGLAFGLSAGLLTILIVTAIYAAVGVVVGFINAVILNYLLGVSRGLSITVEEEK